jgi:hypothetical protein
MKVLHKDYAIRDLSTMDFGILGDPEPMPLGYGQLASQELL